MLENDGIHLDTFYVYKSLHSDESWRAILVNKEIKNLPNISFGMKVFAINEKEAITRGRDLYEKIHKHDNDRDVMRKFMSSAIRSITQAQAEGINGYTDINKNMDLAIEIASVANNKYKEYFNNLNKENVDEQYLKRISVLNKISLEAIKISVEIAQRGIKFTPRVSLLSDYSAVSLEWEVDTRELFIEIHDVNLYECLLVSNDVTVAEGKYLSKSHIDGLAAWLKFGGSVPLPDILST